LTYRQDPEELDDEYEYEDEEPPSRSPLIPILAIVASLLAIGIGVAVVLYSIGVFGGRSAEVAEVLSEPAPRGIGETAPPELPQQQETTPTQDVPEAQVAAVPPAAGEPAVRSTHGDWQIRCDTPAGSQSEQCVLMQFVTAEDRDNVGLTVIILKTADRQARIMRILAPLGVLLPSGLGLRIDQSDMGRAGFVRCLPNGCVAEVILSDQLLGSLRSGQTATFIISQTPEEGIGIPISLAGFGPGFDALP
jgi:invasion protein IalB